MPLFIKDDDNLFHEILENMDKEGRYANEPDFLALENAIIDRERRLRQIKIDQNRDLEKIKNEKQAEINRHQQYIRDIDNKISNFAMNKNPDSEKLQKGIDKLSQEMNEFKIRFFDALVGMEISSSNSLLKNLYQSLPNTESGIKFRKYLAQTINYCNKHKNRTSQENPEQPKEKHNHCQKCRDECESLESIFRKAYEEDCSEDDAPNLFFKIFCHNYNPCEK